MTFCQKLSCVLERSAYCAVDVEAGKGGLGLRRGRELQGIQEFIHEHQCTNSKPAVIEGIMRDLEKDAWLWCGLGWLQEGRNKGG